MLDALGAADFSREQAEQFLRSRDEVLSQMHEVAETKIPALDRKQLTEFTLNDTLVLVYRTPGTVAAREVEQFCHLLRIVETLSIRNHILFRGAFAVGELFQIDPGTNTVMGPPVRDAAAWYGRAEWIGIHATPHASLFIQSLQEKSGAKLSHVLVDTVVPLKDKSLKTKAINWPKGFFIRSLRPAGGGSTRGLVLELLAQHAVPIGTEAKYQNTVDFFDQVVKDQALVYPVLQLDDSMSAPALGTS